MSTAGAHLRHLGTIHSDPAAFYHVTGNNDSEVRGGAEQKAALSIDPE
ncbi:hypothetical protein Slin15195_G034940 [Septoria linicola]|uniref:Uncharacterized protein n=1 Tax=Septoria linicola TaxID=215465 RepID=A0A9Q9EGN5_9PEZI|nr:hypothetical protein Slin15195_G034940 [Septoria linicola]